MSADPEGVIPELPRASALDSCVRAQVARLLGYDAGQVPARMQAAFDAGNEWEARVAARLKSDGHVLLGEQMELTLAGVATGHIDWLFQEPDGSWVIEDCKAFAEAGFKKLRDEGFDAYPRYRVQGSIYHHALKLPFRLRVVNKASWDGGDEWEEILISLTDPIPLEELQARAAEILSLATAGTLPECDRKDYPCPMWHIGGETGCRAPKTGPAYPELVTESINFALLGALANLKDARAMGAIAKKAEENAKEIVMGLLGDKTEARAGRLAVKVTTSHSRRFDQTAAKEFLRGHHPAEYAAILADLETLTPSTRITVTEIEEG